MKISDLKPGKVINLEVTVVMLDTPTETPNGKKVQEGVVEDETGQTRIALWEEEIGKYIVGDKILLVTGWSKEFQGVQQISTGRFGKIQKVGATKNA